MKEQARSMFTTGFRIMTLWMLGQTLSRLTILPAGEKRMQSWPFSVTFPSGRTSTT